MIKIKVDGSVVSVQETQALYCGTQDVHTCSFVFDESWEKYSKSAVFRVNGKAITAVVDENNTCTLPWELLVRDNIGAAIEVGVYGISADAEILTTVWDSIGTVREGTELGSDAREPSAGVYEQVMASVKQVDNRVVSYSTEVRSLTQRAETAAALTEAGIKDAEGSALVANNAAEESKSVLASVRNALDELPEGSTLVINDLTTGGTSAALSAEMGKVLNRRPNPNLLHNWYFGNPVNQRGLSQYSGAAKYTIDRWKSSSSRGIIDVLEGSLKITSTAESTTYAILTQSIENGVKFLGNTMTFSVLDTDGELYSFSGVITQNALIQQDYSFGRLRFGSDTTWGDLYVMIAVNAGGSSKAFVAAKMELGDTQTLAHWDGSKWVLNEIPDYGEELAKCQRYQMEYGAVQYAQPWSAVATSATSARVVIHTPVELRAIPATVFDINSLVLYDGTTNYAITKATVYTKSGNSIVLDISSSGLTAGKSYMVRATADTKIILDANL